MNTGDRGNSSFYFSGAVQKQYNQFYDKRKIVSTYVYINVHMNDPKYSLLNCVDLVKNKKTLYICNVYIYLVAEGIRISSSAIQYPVL